MPPAARVGDLHVCPAGSAGPVNAPGSVTVNIGGKPAARAGDRATCSGSPDTIVQGSPTVFIDHRPAARASDPCSHGGMVLTGCTTVNIGNSPSFRGTGTSAAAPEDEDERRRGVAAGVEIRTPSDAAPSVKPPDKAVARPSDTSTKSPTTKTSDTKGPQEQESEADPAPETPAEPKLHGVGVSMDTIRSLLDVAKQLLPGLGNQIPPVDPQMVQATVVELREAIARRDVEAMNSISARLTGLLQGSGMKEPPAPTDVGSPSINRWGRT